MQRAILGFLAVTVATALALRLDLLLVAAYAVFLVYLAARVWARRTASGLRLERRLPERAFAGEKVSAEIVVHNPSRLPVPWLELHESVPMGLALGPMSPSLWPMYAEAGHRSEVLSVPGRGTARMRYTLDCRHRGYHRVGPLTAETGDVLGLVPSLRREVPAARLIVYPRVVPIERLGLPTRSPLAVLPTRVPLFHDPTRVVGVRGYEPGDPQRSIHWTATAASGQVMVKRHQPATARDTVVVLDMDRSGHARGQRATTTELAVITAASLVHHVAIRERLAAGLLTHAYDPLVGAPTRVLLPPRTGRTQLMSCLEVLARVGLGQGSPVGAVLTESAPQLPWGASLVVVTGALGVELAAALATLRRTGFAVAVVVAGDDPAVPDGGDLAIPVYRVEREGDLELLG